MQAQIAGDHNPDAIAVLQAATHKSRAYKVFRRRFVLTMLQLEAKDVFAIALSSAALLVSVTTFVLNYRYARRNAVLSRKPVLVFEYAGERGWLLRNAGSGPALNIVVAQKRVGGEWFNPVRIPPLARDGEFLLIWLGHVNTTGLGAIYCDTENSPYTSTCGNDLSRTAEGHGFGPWTEAVIGRHWNHPPYIE